MHGPRGPLGPLDAPAPSPPVLLSKLPFSTFPTASRTPDLGVGGFERAAPTAADPREKLLSDPWRRRGSEAQKTLRVVITYRGVAPPWGAASKALTVNGSAGFYGAVEVGVAC